MDPLHFDCKKFLLIFQYYKNHRWHIIRATWKYSGSARALFYFHAEKINEAKVIMDH
jgi:hypothetical protein